MYTIDLIFFSFHIICKWRPGQLSRYSDSLRAGRFGDRIPVGAQFSAPVQNEPGAHPASCTMGTGSFPGVKRPGRGVDHPPPSSAEVEGRVELYIYSPSGPSWAVLRRTLPLPLSYANGFHFLMVILRNSLHPVSKLSMEVIVYNYFGQTNKEKVSYLHVAVPVKSLTSYYGITICSV